jgi:hypothetical protein
MSRLIVLFAMLLAVGYISASIASFAQAQQNTSRPPPAWQDLAIEAQKNATLDQISANAIIASLQAEIAALKAELAKVKAPGTAGAPVTGPPGGMYDNPPPKGTEKSGG